MLELPVEKIDFELWATGHVDYDSGIGGMRATRVNTAVAYQAAQDAKETLFKLAADTLRWPQDRLELRGEEIRLVNSEDSVRWTDLLAQTGQDVTGSALVEDRARAEKTCFATQIAEVEVDPETGEVKLLSMVSGARRGADH